MNIKNKKIKPILESSSLFDSGANRPRPNRPRPMKPTMNNPEVGFNVNTKDTSILEDFVDSVNDKPTNWKSINKTLAGIGMYAATTFLKKKLDKELKLDASNSSPSMYVRYWKTAVREILDMLSEGQKLLLVKKFGVDIIKALNESHDINEQVLPQQEIEDIETFIFGKGGKFEFDCGVEMETLNAPNTDLSKFQQSLKYHAAHTNSFSEFVESVRKFINFTDNELTDFDIEKLENHYIKYHGRVKQPS